MRAQTGVSRRHLLALSAAAGGIALSGGLRRASAQVAKRIERLDPALDSIISASEPIRELAAGMGGPSGPVEGPVWWKEGGYLLFSDIQASKRMKYTPGQGVTLFQDKTNEANGLTRDLQGRLLACEHETRRVVRLELDGSITVVANSFQGQRLNRPNDVIVKSDGAIYFTDPMGFVPAHDQWDLTYTGVIACPLIAAPLLCLRMTLCSLMGSHSRRMKACSTSAIIRVTILGLSTWPRMARWRNRPTAFSLIFGDLNQVGLTA
jgi:hypothetical protein